MGIVNSSGNFLRSFLTKEQRILLKFNAGNIILADDSGDCCGGSEEEEQDIDDRMIANLTHKNVMCSIFTLAKLTNVLDPLTKKKLSEFELNLFRNSYNKDFDDKEERSLLDKFQEVQETEGGQTMGALESKSVQSLQLASVKIKDPN